MRRRSRISDEYRSLERQTPREYGVPGPPDSFTLYRVRVQQLIPSGDTGTALLMLPTAAPAYYGVTTTQIPVANPAGIQDLQPNDEVFVFWHAASRMYIRATDGVGGGSAKLAKAEATIPARVDADTPGQATVKPMRYNGTNFVEEGTTVDILSWVQADSADPTQDEKLYIYIWIEKHTDGYWYWTGEDCPVIDPGDPVDEQPGGGQIQSNANLVVIL